VEEKVLYNTERQTKKFDTDNLEDLKEYDAILNNPLCSIISERPEKLTTKHFDDEGNLSSQDDRLIKLVTWEVKVLA